MSEHLHAKAVAGRAGNRLIAAFVEETKDKQLWNRRTKGLSYNVVS